jgi:hypothetical protein
MAKALTAVARDARGGGKNTRRGRHKNGRGCGSHGGVRAPAAAHVASRSASSAAPTFAVAAAEVADEQARQRPRWRPTNREACQKKAPTAFALWLQRHKGEWHRPTAVRLRRKTSVFREDLMHLKFASLVAEERFELELEAAREKQVNEQKRKDLKAAKRVSARAPPRDDAAVAAVAAETPVAPFAAVAALEAKGALSSSLSVVQLAVASFSPLAEEEPFLSPAVAGGQSFRWHETSGISRSVWLPQDANRLGAGSFGTVFLVRDMQSEALLALKLSSGRDVGEEGASLQSEWCLFRRARHENIVCCFGLCVGSAAGSIGIVLEAADGNLWQWILERRSKQETSPRRGGGAEAIEAIERAAIAQLGRGLAHLHACSIVHLDIKPENMLVQSRRDASDREIRRFMISDLGNAFDLEGFAVREAAVAAMSVGRSGRRGGGNPVVLARLVQSPQYRPACCFESHEVRCGPYLDVWAFACVVFEIVARNWEATRSGRHLRLQGGVREDWSSKDVHALRNRRLSSCCPQQITPLILAAQGRHFSASTVSSILKDFDSVLQLGGGRGGGRVTAPGAEGAAVAAPAAAEAATAVISSDSD